MSTHVHQLAGCTPTPLGYYLKALAVIRLVSEQRDPGARAFWRDETFWLATSLTRDELIRFFLEEYRPTPILSPWNGGSGFFYENDVGLTPLERSTAPRFEPFRQGIAAARAICAPLAEAFAAIKTADEAVKRGGREAREAASNAKEAKARGAERKDALLGECRRRWSGGLLEWFDVALALDGKGEASWPALVGSGGNDGRLDFTNNSMQHLAALFDCADPKGRPTALAGPMLGAALFAEPAPGLLARAAGQFVPGAAGGANMGAGFVGDSRVNPWDFVLTLEGTIVLASSVVRTADAGDLPQAAAPFAVRSAAAGYVSASIADEGPRGEQWMPCWSQPARYAEVRALFAEGRTRLGRSAAQRGLDSAKAVARLGVARGIDHFERYGYIERNGQANLAVPLGRWTVEQKVKPGQELLDQIEPWMGAVRRLARSTKPDAPKRIVSAARQVDEAILAVCRPDAGVSRWQTLLCALGTMEQLLVQLSGAAADPQRGLSPLPVLDPAWLVAADDHSSEFRLAMALASQEVLLGTSDKSVYGSVRAHWMPLEREGLASRPGWPRRSARFATAAKGLTRDSDVVGRGLSLENDCIALMRRRMQHAASTDGRDLGLVAGRGAPLSDVVAFLNGQVNDAKIWSLARPMMAIAWWQRSKLPEADNPARTAVDVAHAIVHQAYFPDRVDEDTMSSLGPKTAVRLDPAPLAQLVAGQLVPAIDGCLRRLRASGLRPKVRHVLGDARRAQRLAASLAFPLYAEDAIYCARVLLKPGVFVNEKGSEAAHD